MKVTVIIATLAFVAQGSLAQEGGEPDSSLPGGSAFPPVKLPRPWPPRPWPKPWPRPLPMPWPRPWPRPFPMPRPQPWPRPLPMPWPQPEPRVIADTDMQEDTSNPAALIKIPPWLRPWIRPKTRFISTYSGLDADTFDDDQPSTMQRRSILPREPWRPRPWPRPWPRPNPFPRPTV